ncbi:MAG TPA: SMC family ATPase [Saprospiraceae bacterium]|nr:SMC family ATPase [Saprospiraceae bacterium]
MKLKLTDFRCHANRTFNIPESGLINISGDSGDGKSTIFSAIVYVLYGKIPGKYKRPYARKKTTCKVRLQYEALGLDITRTKPKNIIVKTSDQTYEGDAAQCIIEDTIGMTYDEFIAGAYIIQRSNASVLSMTPTEQVKFIEILASTNADNFKLLIKEKQKNISDTLLKLQGKMESFQTLLREAETNLSEEPETPQEIQDGIDPSKIRLDIKDKDKLARAIQDEIEGLQPALEKSRKNDAKYKANKEKIEILKATIKSNNQSIKKIGKLEDVEPLKKQLEDLKDRLIYNKKLLAVQERKQKFLEAFEEYKSSTELTLKNIESTLLTKEQIVILEDELTFALEYKEEYDREKAVYDSLAKKKTSAKKKISSIFQDIKNDSFLKSVGLDKNIKTPIKMIKTLKAIQEQISCTLECPSCNATVFITKGKLKISTFTSSGTSSGRDEHNELQRDKIENWIGDLSKYTEDANNHIEFVMEEPKDVMAMQKNYMRRKRDLEEYEKLKEQKLPPVLSKMESSIQKDEEKLLEYDLKPEDIDYLESEIEETKKVVEKIERQTEDLAMLQNQNLANQNKIKKLEESLDTFNKDGTASKKIEESLSNATKKMIGINEEISDLRDILENIKEYEDYQSQLLNIKTQKRRIKKLKRQINDETSLLEGYIGLQDICKEAEILALEDTVNSINEHAKIYLDYFFEDPILVRLECVKEVKSKKSFKLQMNTSIEYKGDTFGDIEELSGGERQRCDMAYLLAVSDILGGKMLLLDECLNNLDASINTEVLGLVRDLCGTEKLVLVISHEAVKGLFDDEIIAGKK